MKLGEKVRCYREREGLSTYELADKVLASQSMINHIEMGVKNPSVDLLKRIATYFNVSVDELLKGYGGIL